MLKEYTCIICPNGCDIEVTFSGDDIENIQGALCEKGADYVNQEIKSPMRTIQTSVLVKNGQLPITSVTTTKPIPKDMIFDIVAEIKRHMVTAPVFIGQVVIKNVLNTGSDVVVTKDIQRQCG